MMKVSVDAVYGMVNSKGKTTSLDNVAFMICKTKHVLRGRARAWPVVPLLMPKLVFVRA
jgi:hypothetical protein